MTLFIPKKDRQMVSGYYVYRVCIWAVQKRVRLEPWPWPFGPSF